MANAEQKSKAPIWCSSRLALTIIGFFGFVNLYALRVNMSVAIVCMTKDGGCGQVPETVNGTGGNSTCVSLQEEGEADRYDWDKKTQGLILGSFFWGYTVTQLPGGWLAGRYGGKHVFGWSMFVCALATLLVPLAADVGIWLLLVVRVIAGMGQGVVWPSMQVLFAHWAPPLERSKLSGFVYAGAQIGNVVAFPLCGLLCEYGFAGGWPSIFYVFVMTGIYAIMGSNLLFSWIYPKPLQAFHTSGLGVVWFILWMVIVYDSPVLHPRISPDECSYIVTSLSSDIDVSKKNETTPWLSIVTSLPVWAIIVTHMCCNWGTYTFLTNIPSYMRDVFQFDIRKAAFLTALPYIGFWAITNVSGQLVDFMRTRGWMNTTTARKLFNSLGSLVPALFIVLTGYLGRETMLATTFLTIGVAMSGCQYGSGFIVNPVDIAPRYAGIIFGISNTTGTLGGFLAPIVIGWITTDKSFTQWRLVFVIAAAIYTFGALFYLVFGSGDVQSWATEGAVMDQEMEVGAEPETVSDNGISSKREVEM